MGTLCILHVSKTPFFFPYWEKSLFDSYSLIGVNESWLESLGSVRR